MLQRLPKALVQVKAGNTSQNLLNEIRQIIYSLYQGKEIIYQYNEINKCIIQKWILYFWILKKVKQLILLSYR